MGDSGTQVLGFTLAASGSPRATPSRTDRRDAGAPGARPRRADPRHDARNDRPAVRGRPVYQGGRDHSSHRLVYARRLRDRRVILLARVSAALGATSLAYRRSAAAHRRARRPRDVRAARPVRQLPRRRRSQPRTRTGAPLPLHAPPRRGRRRRRADRRLVSRGIPLRFDAIGTPNQRHYFLLTLPVLLFCRYAALLLIGMYPESGATRARATRCGQRLRSASRRSSRWASSCSRGRARRLPRSVFVIDALICTVAIVGASRFAERAIIRGIELARSGEGRRVLIVGAGRTRTQHAARAARDTGRAGRRRSSTTIHGCEAGG